MPAHRKRLLDNLKKLATNNTSNCPKNSTHMYLWLSFERWSTLDTISIHFGFINVYNLMLKMGNDDSI
jgi:hypothetical protein